MKNLTNKTIKTLLAIFVIVISLSSCVNREDDPTPSPMNGGTENVHYSDRNSIVENVETSVKISNDSTNTFQPKSIGVDTNSIIDANAPIMGGSDETIVTNEEGLTCGDFESVLVSTTTEGDITATIYNLIWMMKLVLSWKTI